MKPNLISSYDEIEISKIKNKYKLSEKEYDIFENKVLLKSPTVSELAIASAMWNEHCSYKSSKLHLKKLFTKNENVVIGPGENAGIVRIEGNLCAAFKMESHNHPSFIEPYQGAATGVGGIMRDIFCMGARPIANLNCLRFSKLDHKKTKYLFEKVVKGIGDYGNCVGVATIGGNISFHDSYKYNPLVNAMTIGIIEEDKIFKGLASGEGNYIVYVGSSTGRDGILGANMASDSFKDQDSTNKSVIQVGDPFKEKLLLEATLEALDKKLVLGLQDMGAAGLISSAMEMALKGSVGLYINLNKIPVRTSNMKPEELILSESQERMLMVVNPKDWSKLKKIFDKWDLDHNIIGHVTLDRNLKMTYNDVLEVDIPLDSFQKYTPVYDRPYEKKYKSNCKIDQIKIFDDYIKSKDINNLLENIFHFDFDKSFIYHQYDHHIGNATVLSSEDQGASVLSLKRFYNKSQIGIVVSTSGLEKYSLIDSYLGAQYSVLRCAQSIISAGGIPLAITDCLNYGNPEEKKIMSQFVQAIEGINKACQILNTPVISGNVSFYNQTGNLNIAPTPMIGMLGKVKNIKKVYPASLKNKEKGDIYIVIPKNAKPILHGSLINYIENILNDKNSYIEPINWQDEILIQDIIKKIYSNLDIKVIRNISSGGLISTVSKICHRSKSNFNIHIDEKIYPKNIWAFGEFASFYILISEDNLIKFFDDNFSNKYKDRINLLNIGKINNKETNIFQGQNLFKKY